MSGIKKLSFPDVQVHIVDAPLGAGPESILPVVVMDSGLARSLSSGRALRGPVGAPRNDGRVVQGLASAGRADRRPVLKTGRLRWTLAGAERPAITDDGAAGDLSAAARPAPLKDYRHA